MSNRLTHLIGRSFLLAVVGLGVLALRTNAQIVTLSDGDSSSQINTAAQAGMFNWSVDGVNQMHQEWFWYRIGSTGPQFSIDTISAPSISQPTANQMTVSYANAQMSVSVQYTMTGGTPGSGSADINENIQILNKQPNLPLDLHFFEYSDFDLNGSPAGDTVTLGTSHGLYNLADQTKGATALAETVAAPGANRAEANIFPSTLNSLNSGSAYTLNDNAGPVGPGDATWAMEWDDSLVAGTGSLVIGKDKSISGVPEPGSLSLVSLGLLALGWRKHRLGQKAD